MLRTAFTNGTSHHNFLTQARTNKFQWFLLLVRLVLIDPIVVHPNGRKFLKLAIGLFIKTVDRHIQPANDAS